ncbi:MAG: ABC transporter permease [Deltaproteobacteria bacterium]|nr:ABC transporter permease [Deltaproteobacteria bacterium]MCW8892677.1 ABC transporter permease [Deltaproteobacteria bacterium]MCW9050469.1 ABC transporter permease [Deltaproteobacteria bacterium]
MNYLYESLLTAIRLIFQLDPEVQAAVWTSLYTSSTAIVFAGLIGIPSGLWLGLSNFRGRRVLITLLNTLMALPTVVVGLLLFGLLSRQGPLGSWGLLFTPVAMILGQLVLATPIVANLVLAAVAGADKRILPTLITLGASPFQASIQLLKELRFGIMAAIIAGFGRVIAEVGVAMMLGGNIRGLTRTMTTAIALETSKGEFAFGLALGIILLAVALLVNLGLNFLQQR